MIKKLFKKLGDKYSKLKSTKDDLVYWDNKRKDNIKLNQDLEEVRIIFQKASQITQKQLANQISKTVSAAIAAVFDDPYKFKVNFVSRRNVTECDLLFEKNGKTKHPLDSCGYGVADIASLALRIAYWKLEDNSINTLILDEPTRALSAGKQGRAAMMIKNLSKIDNGLQFIIVTHNKILAESADRRFKVVQQNDISEVHYN